MTPQFVLQQTDGGQFKARYQQRTDRLICSQRLPIGITRFQDSPELAVSRQTNGITISTATLLIIANVFFRMLCDHRILAVYAATESLSGQGPVFPGRLPLSLGELPEWEEKMPLQARASLRTEISRFLTDEAIDFLVLQQVLRATATDATGDRYVLEQDTQAMLRLLERAQRRFPNAVHGTDYQHLLLFAVNCLFHILQPLESLPAAIRMVNLQQTLTAVAEPLKVQAGNESIIAVALMIGRTPQTDGFNGYLHPGSKARLDAVASATKKGG